MSEWDHQWLLGVREWGSNGWLIVNDFMIGRQRFQSTFSVQDEAVHTAMNKPVARLYTMTNVVRFEPLIDRTIRRFMDILDTRFASVEQPCPIDKWLHYCALPVLMSSKKHR